MWLSIASIFFVSMIVFFGASMWKHRRSTETETTLEAAQVQWKLNITVLVAVIAIFCLTASAAIAFFGPNPLTDAQANLQNTLNTIGVSGAGALFGLLGGKVAS